VTAITLDALGLGARASSALPVEHADRLAATLDRPRPDGPLPITWHWIYFVPAVAASGLGPDGHPRRPAGRLTQDFPRRMFAGGRLTSSGGLRPGAPAVRHSEVVDAEEKQGRSGGLLLVTIRHRYEQNGEYVLSEEQDLVYLPASTEPTPAPEPGGERREEPWQRIVLPERPLLFRYSALTFNAHRIHYDQAYASAEEGYPALVVHGPLTATLLADLAVDELGRPLGSFSFRARAPLFVDQPVTLVGRPDGDDAVLEAVRVDGATAMTALAG
jgi:3-methylfumaryl-CoA hydratase